MSNVGDLLEERVSPDMLGAVRAVALAAARLRLPLYLVGGTVRDILLSTAVSDLDLTVVGDGPDAVDRLAQRLDGRVLARSQFGTMKVDVAGTVIDLALARTESYSRPGALPEVTAGGIEQDLYQARLLDQRYGRVAGRPVRGGHRPVRWALGPGRSADPGAPPPQLRRRRTRGY